jgi:hypothetical protein
MWKHMTSVIGVIALLASTGANAGLLFIANLNPLEEIITAPAASGTPVAAGGVLKPFTAGAGATDPAALRPLSFGSATFALNDAGTALTMVATIFNIDITGSQTPGANDNLVNGHIHSGNLQSTDSRGVDARVITWGFFGAPDNDIAPSQLVVTPFLTGVGGTISSVWDAPEGNLGTTLAAQLPRLIAGLGYLNFHTAQFGNGEIRGTLVVPEPGSLALLALALGGVYLAQRRRRTA